MCLTCFVLSNQRKTCLCLLLTEYLLRICFQNQLITGVIWGLTGVVQTHTFFKEILSTKDPQPA